MPHVSGIGTWFAPGSASAANNASDAIDATLTPGSTYYNAADTGAAGDAIIQGAAGLQNVGANFQPIDKDTAALGALSTQYLHNYLGRGVLTQAQQAQSAADLARLNSSELLAGSQKAAQQVGNVKQSEDAANAAGATQNRAQAAALQLKKAAMQMLISHTNNMTAIERQKLQYGVQSLGAQAAQSLQEGANQARANQMSIYEGGRMTGAQTAMQIGTGIASGAATAAGTLANQLGTPSSLGATAGESITATPTDYHYAGGTGDSRGYATPDYSLVNQAIATLGSGNSKMTLLDGTPTYSPFAATQANPSYPGASAWGENSLNIPLSK